MHGSSLLPRLGVLSLLVFGCGSEPGPDQTTSPGPDPDTGSPPLDLSCPEGEALGLETTTGCILGADAGALEQWIGVPYAASPVGELRFARTTPVEPWEAPLEADRFGEVCLQWDVDGGLTGDEDCLTLNVFRPGGTEAGAGLPVLFYTHGGYYTQGSGSQDVYVLEPQLAEQAIVVTHNYRLGPMGFFAHEDLTDEDGATHGDGGSSGNQGLFDSLMALQWTMDNAEALGGDPSRVLAFGESAGAATTCALLASPLAEGLFSAAMIQSVACGFMERPLRDLAGSEYTESAEMLGTGYASRLGCSGSETLDCLRGLDEEDILTELQLDSFGVNVDEVFLPLPARQAFSEGAFNQVPVYAGVTENEGVIFTYTYGLAVEDADTLADWLTWYSDTFGLSDADALIEVYDPDAFGSPQLAFDAFYGDMFFACPTRSFLEAVSPHVETRGYLFAEAPDWLQYYDDFAHWGAFHSAELPFVFGTQPEYYTALEWTLAEAMQDSWVSTLGTPTVDGIGDWPLFDAGGGVSANGGTLVHFEAGATEVTDGVFEERCDRLDELGWHNY